MVSPVGGGITVVDLAALIAKMESEAEITLLQQEEDSDSLVDRLARMSGRILTIVGRPVLLNRPCLVVEVA